MFSCGSHNGFISTINAVLSFQLLFLCFHFYSTVLSLGQAFAGGGAWGSAAVPHDRATCQGQPGLPQEPPELPQPQTPLHDENSALNTLRESRASCRQGQEKPNGAGAAGTNREQQWDEPSGAQLPWAFLC